MVSLFSKANFNSNFGAHMAEAKTDEEKADIINIYLVMNLGRLGAVLHTFSQDLLQLISGNGMEIFYVYDVGLVATKAYNAMMYMSSKYEGKGINALDSLLGHICPEENGDRSYLLSITAYYEGNPY